MFRVNRSLEQLQAQCFFSYTRSSGPGGQHVNKTDSAVVILHKPTGLKFKVNEFRSQYQNKQCALERLQAILQKKEADILLKQAALRFKLKPKRRPRSLKEKILKTKKLTSQKKSLRRVTEAAF